MHERQIPGGATDCGYEELVFGHVRGSQGRSIYVASDGKRVCADQFPGGSKCSPEVPDTLGMPPSPGGVYEGCDVMQPRTD
jgi:hypothetical protein